MITLRCRYLPVLQRIMFVLVLLIGAVSWTAIGFTIMGAVLHKDSSLEQGHCR